MPLEFAIISEIIRLGSVDAQRRADPSTSEVLRAEGVGIVTAYIEQLALIRLVTDPGPIFGSDGGMWIAYRLTDRGHELSHTEAELRRAVAGLIGGPATETSGEIFNLIAECRLATLNANYRDDFLRTLEEMAICFDHKCYMATMALSGKVLEVCLKETLIRGNVAVDPNAMIGTLIAAVRLNFPARYYDEALGNVANIINQSRRTAVHADRGVPIPSRDQASMVIFAVLDVVRRNLAVQRNNPGG